MPHVMVEEEDVTRIQCDHYLFDTVEHIESSRVDELNYARDGVGLPFVLMDDLILCTGKKSKQTLACMHAPRSLPLCKS